MTWWLAPTLIGVLVVGAVIGGIRAVFAHGDRLAEAAQTAYLKRLGADAGRFDIIDLRWPLQLVRDLHTGRQYLVNRNGGSIELAPKDIE